MSSTMINDFDSDKLDDILYPDNLDWTFDKPTGDQSQYHTIYIIKKKEEEDEPGSSYSNLIEPKNFVRVPMVEEDCPYGSDRCTKLGRLRFRPQTKRGECGGCKGVCEECERLMLSDDEDEECDRCGNPSVLWCMSDGCRNLDEEDEDCECGNNREKGYDPKGNMRCEDCDIDGINYNGGLTDEE